MKAISHLSSLRSKKRRERLEWLGDSVMEEAIVRLVAREAMAALERERGKETAAGGGGSDEEKKVLPSLTGSALCWRLDSAIRVAVSNANLSAVYGTQLVGLMGLLGLEEDHLGVPGGKRCRSSFSLGLHSPSLTAPTASERKADKLLPDLVESAIGEAFEASLALGLRSGLQSSGPQRFAGRHRAALVDRLLSSALCTEFVLANANSGRGGGGWSTGSSGVAANSFGVLDTDDDDDDDHSVDNDDAGVNKCKGREVGEEEEEKKGENKKEGEEKKEKGEGNAVMGGGFRSFDPSGNADADMDADARNWTEAAGERVQATGEGGATAVEGEGAQRGDSSGNDGGGAGGGGSSDGRSSGGGSGDGGGSSSDGGGSSSSSTCRRARNLASGMEAIFRRYGAALIKFRVSVFLYCSAPAVASAGVVEAAGGGGDDEQGPSELTIRRQRVMCAENLEAVAAYLRPTGEGGRAPHSPGAPDARDVPEASTARQWMRVAVGRAALCEKGDASFSTRVSALLLSRSGERGGPPRNVDYVRLPSGTAKAEGASARGGERERAGKFNHRETKALAAAAAMEAASMAAATAEVHFGRDPWPERDLPRAREKAALIFRNRNSKADTGPSRPPPLAKLGPGNDPRDVGACSRHDGDCQGDTSGDDSTDAVLGMCTPSTAPPPLLACTGEKRKRAPEGRESRGAVEPYLPPHYVRLVGGLPRDSRLLLARLGHQGYVKVLEEILDRFLHDPNAPPLDVQQGAVTTAAAAAAATQEASLTRATPATRPLGKARRVTAISTMSTIASGAAVVGEADAACLQPALTEAPNLWRAVQTGKPHPSLSGLVEPPELALTGPKRLVLPIPNPFYRRVLHALCQVHGLCSHGGETSGRDRGTGAGRKKTAAVRHRTVEITRIAADGSGGRRRGRPECRTGVTALIPVETLLAAR